MANTLSPRVLLPGLLLAATCFMILSPVAMAQQTNPGLILQPEIQDLNQPDEGVPDKQKDIPEDPDKVEIDVPENEKGTDLGGGPSFQVSRIDLEGNSLFSTEELKPILQKYEGREVTLDDLGKAVDEITQRYRDEGYLTTQAFVPPQDIEGGIVKIQIVEGTVGQIEVSGNKYYKAWAIAREVGYEPGEPLNVTNLEETLNRVNRAQNFRLRAVLKAGEEPGETDIRFAVAERQPWQISPSWDNQGRPFVGIYRFGAAVTNSNLTGIGDRLTTRYIGAAGTQIGAISYFAPINNSGTEVGYSYAYSFVDVEGLPNRGAFETEITGYANNHSLMVVQPLDEERVWTLDAAFNARRITSRVHTTHANQDEIRSLTLGLTYNKPDTTGRTFFRLQTDIAPNLFATNRRTFLATDKEGTPGAVEVTAGSRQFWKGSAYATRLQRMPWQGHLLILRGSAQYSPDDLPSAEEYQIGGAFSVRGFTEGLLIGDRGYNLSAEYRLPVPGLKYVNEWLDNRVQCYGFFDMGQVWMDRSNPAFNTAVHNNSRQRTLLMGTGFGVQARLTRFMIGFLDVGFPLSKQASVESNNRIAFPDARIHFGVRSDLLSTEFKERGTDATRVKEKAFLNRENEVAARLAQQQAEDEAYLQTQQRSLSEDVNADPIEEMTTDDVSTDLSDASLDEVYLSSAESVSEQASAPQPQLENDSVVPEAADTDTVEGAPAGNDELQFDHPVALPMVR